MVNTKDILNYYEYLENLYNFDSEEYFKLRLQAERTFLNSNNHQKEVDNIIALESYNISLQNSLMVWKLIEGEEIEDDKGLLKIFNTTITNDKLKDIVLSEDILTKIKEPIGVKFKSEQIKMNFILSRAIFMKKCGYESSPSKEYVINLINEGILNDVQKIMRYLHRTVVMNIKSTGKINITKEKLHSNNETSYEQLSKLQGIFDDLKSEYKMELKRYGSIAL